MLIRPYSRPRWLTRLSAGSLVLLILSSPFLLDIGLMTAKSGPLPNSLSSPGKVWKLGINWIRDEGCRHGVNVTEGLERMLLRLQEKIKYRREEARKRRTRWKLYLHSPGRCSVFHWHHTGRLGNFLFMMASLYGISVSNGCIPYLHRKSPYNYERYLEHFPITKRNLRSFRISPDRIVHGKDNGFGKFIPSLMNMNLTREDVLDLSGWLQSWKFFDQYGDDVRALLLFNATVFNNAIKMISEGINADPQLLRLAKSGPKLVGVHVRRGDLLTEEQINFGQTTPPESYYKSIIERISLFPTPVLFIVASDDLPYCRTLFRGHPAVFLNGDPASDMAALGLTEMLLLSVGSFGWWSAYLGNVPIVYYYDGWPASKSIMSTFIEKTDYFPPGWIAHN